MARLLTPVDEIRARFTALDRPLAFFDGPGGTQVPDSVIEAIASYLRESNANLGGLVSDVAADGRSGCRGERHGRALSRRERGRGRVRRQHDDAELRALARGLARVGRRRRDRLHPPGSRRQRRPLARARSRQRPRGPLRRRRRRLPARPRPAPLAALGPHAGRRLPVGVERRRDGDARRRDRRARPRGGSARLGRRRALRTARADRRRRRRRRRVDLLAVQVLRAAPRARVHPRRARRDVADVQGSAGRPRFETGTQPHELLAGFVAAVDYLDDVGWETIAARERSLARQFLDGLPRGVDAARDPDESRTGSRRSRSRTRRSRRRTRPSTSESAASPCGTATTTRSRSWTRLGLADGAVRIGIVHYNTEDEVARLLDALATLAG